MEDKYMLDVLIVGAGPVGLYAAFNSGMRKLKGAVIEALPYPGGQLTTLYAEKPIYDSPGIPYILAKDLVKSLLDQHERFVKDFPVHLNQQIKNIDKKEDHFVVTTTNHTFETKTLLFSSGNGTFEPRKLDMPGKESSNILYRVSDLSMFKDKEVIILGGGDSALDWGVMVKDVAKKAVLIHRRAEFRGHEETLDIFKTKGSVKVPYVIEKLNVVGDKVVSLDIMHKETNEKETVTADFIIVNYGLLPSKNAYDTIGVEIEKNSIKVTPDMASTYKGIFACGNCVIYPGKMKTISTGFGEAATAVNTINGYLNPGKANAVVYSSALLGGK
jgi:thioredoxin reductase (NADPH)